MSEFDVVVRLVSHQMLRVFSKCTWYIHYHVLNNTNTSVRWVVYRLDTSDIESSQPSSHPTQHLADPQAYSEAAAGTQREAQVLFWCLIGPKRVLTRWVSDIWCCVNIRLDLLQSVVFRCRRQAQERHGIDCYRWCVRCHRIVGLIILWHSTTINFIQNFILFTILRVPTRTFTSRQPQRASHISCQD